MPKRSIRAKLLGERKSLSADTCISLSAEVQQQFLRSKLFYDANCLALYSAIHNEVQTEIVSRRALELGKALVYPRIRNDALEFVEVLSREDLAPGAFGVLEPQGDKLMLIETLDLVVVPGVAFDQRGHRLGYGRGFYDRALAECRPGCAKVGFAYDFQLVAVLPNAAHDKTISVLVTETRTLDFSA